MGKNRNDVKAAIAMAIAQKVAAQQVGATPTEGETAKATESARKRKEDALLKQLEETALAEMTASFSTDVASELATDRDLVTRSRYAGTGVAIDGFWDKTPTERIDAIKAKAGEAPIPFTSDDSAAYHSLKHYVDIRSTEDSKIGDTPLASYLMSSRKTVQAPEETATDASQFSSRPSYYFYRTLPHKTDKSKSVRMRAILIVTDDGKPMIATYFRSDAPKDKGGEKDETS